MLAAEAIMAEPATISSMSSVCFSENAVHLLMALLSR
jgi:hypothetical protein